MIKNIIVKFFKEYRWICKARYLIIIIKISNLKIIFDSFKFPSTGYQGSKLKLVDWIINETKNYSYETVFDAFGGTGSVSYSYKKIGKEVTYNDILKFNYQFGNALIENNDMKLRNESVNFILNPHDDIEYKTIIQDNFKDTYFTDDENK